MGTFRIALANLRFPSSPEESAQLAEQAIAEASAEGAGIVRFPECFVPGYRAPGKAIPPVNAVFLEGAWERVRAAASRARIAVILGTERVNDGAPVITAPVVSADGTIAGFQDKV
jgi:predicted amidohydrolase